MRKTTLDRATQGKMANTKAVRARRLGKEENYSRTGMATLLKVCGAIKTMFLAQCFLGWDCFVVHVIIFQIKIISHSAQ